MGYYSSNEKQRTNTKVQSNGFLFLSVVLKESNCFISCLLVPKYSNQHEVHKSRNASIQHSSIHLFYVFMDIDMLICMGSNRMYMDIRYLCLCRGTTCRLALRSSVLFNI